MQTKQNPSVDTSMMRRLSLSSSPAPPPAVASVIETGASTSIPIPPPLFHESKLLYGSNAPGDLRKYFRLGLCVGLSGSVISILTLCCFPTFKENREGRKMYMLGLIPAAILSTTVNVLISLEVISWTEFGNGKRFTL